MAGGILQALRHRLQPWQTVSYHGLRVHYKRCLDGGGSSFGQEYVAFLRGRGMPRQRRAFEWCSGPAFIGFSLLAHDLCETLCVADLHGQAVEACLRTVRDNRLEKRVTVLRSDNLEQIPAHERWQLVVGNPPHFTDRHPGNRRAHDANWRIHRGFYASVASHLVPGGIVLVQENNAGSSASTFTPMIEQGGLSLVFHSEHASSRPAADHYYFLASMRRGERPPTWLPAGPTAPQTRP
jgi:hypothetical protein